MEIAKGIHQFPTGAFNWYVIEEAGRLTLVDAGFPGHYRVFREGLQSLGRTPQDIEAVILTHAHADHMGFAERVAKEAKARVLIHRADAAKAERPMQLPWISLLSNGWRRYTAGMLAQAVVNGVFTLRHVSRPIAFEDGDVLDVPGKPLVFHTPGHTPGEVAFYLESRRVLISGDTLVTRNLYTGEAGQPQLTSPSLNYDYALARKSLSRLSEIGTIQMLPGHGRPWTGNIRDAIGLALKE